MRKIIMITLTIVTINILNSQSPPKFKLRNTGDPQPIIVNVQNVNKDLLHHRALKSVDLISKKRGDGITSLIVSNQSENEFEIRGFIRDDEFVYKAITGLRAQVDVDFKLKISFKDERYRLAVDDIEISFETSGDIIVDSPSDLFNNKGTIKRGYQIVVPLMEDVFNYFSSELYIGIQNENY